MKTIKLTQNRVALVDDQDYGWLNRYTWHTSGPRSSYSFYAVRAVHITKNKQRFEPMHRLILGLEPGDERQCDHIDGNGLNNQRSNLRICSIAENLRNARKLSTKFTSKYKGVSRCKNSKRWRARIGVDQKQIHLGYFPSERIAAHAYNKAALKCFREFARLNIVTV